MSHFLLPGPDCSLAEPAWNGREEGTGGIDGGTKSQSALCGGQLLSVTPKLTLSSVGSLVGAVPKKKLHLPPRK